MPVALVQIRRPSTTDGPFSIVALCDVSGFTGVDILCLGGPLVHPQHFTVGIRDYPKILPNIAYFMNAHVARILHSGCDPGDAITAPNARQFEPQQFTGLREWPVDAV